MSEPLHPPALKRVDARPLDVEFRLRTQHRAKPGQDPFGPALGFGIRIPAQLEVDPPDVIGLPVQERRLPRMERRIEPEPALRRKLGLHVHVDDQEPVAEDLTLRLEPEHRAHRAPRAVADDQPFAGEPVFAVRRVDAQEDVLLARRHLDDLVLPAKLRRRQLGEPVDQDLLEVVLLQIDEGGAAMAAFGLEVERVDELVPEERAADLPLDALPHDPLAAAEPVEDLERAFRVADRPRTHAHRIVVVQHDDGHIVQREVDCGRKADRAGADDDHGTPLRRGVLIGRALVSVDGVRVTSSSKDAGAARWRVHPV